jgi:hypothetical protein
MLDEVARRYGMAVPLSDLIRSSAYRALMVDTKANAAEYDGKANVVGAVCEHLAFQGGHIDWQIWIEAGESPLPRALVFSEKQQTGRRVYSATIGQWNLSAAASDQQFVFQPPSGAKQVSMSTLAPGGGGTATKVGP